MTDSSRVQSLRPASSEGKKPDLFTKGQGKLDAVLTSEIVIALCGPIGSPLHEVAESLKSILSKEFSYKTGEIIRLSEFIQKFGIKETPAIEAIKQEKRSQSYKDKRILIEVGNGLRKDYSASVLADLAIHHIAKSRVEQKETEARRVFHIIDSIKNQEELEALRSVYGDMLYFLGVFSPLEVREKNLEDAGMSSAEVHSLIDQDSGEEIYNGQTVRETFPQADFFFRIDADTDSQIKGKVERLLHLVLGTRIITPTLSETAMFKAASAAGNSACLSRQVGAAVTNEHGEMLAVGWNDVPKKGGGLYAFDPNDPAGDRDRRCWNMGGGTCFNDAEKDLLAQLITDELVSQSLLDPAKRTSAVRAIRDNKKLSGLIEFSRSIHAEMHAILSAGQLDGTKLRHGKLFVTTYPCHSCARHIIAAGISEVYYIEPYRKSLAMKLHKDSLTERETETSDKVKILMYEGVAPARYLGVFRVPSDSRKKNGKMIIVDQATAKPRFSKTLEAVPVLESMKVRLLQEKNLIPVEPEK